MKKKELLISAKNHIPCIVFRGVLLRIYIIAHRYRCLLYQYPENLSLKETPVLDNQLS